MARIRERGQSSLQEQRQDIKVGNFSDVGRARVNGDQEAKRSGHDGDVDTLSPKTEEIYGGIRKSYQRQVVSLLLPGREKCEPPGGLAQSMEIRTRMICGRILETEIGPVKAQHAIQLVKQLVARASRWKGALAAYDFDIIYTKGSEDVVTDILSRQVNAKNIRMMKAALADEDYAERFLNNCLWSRNPFNEVVPETDGERVYTRHTTYKHTSIVQMTIRREATDDKIRETLEEITEDCTNMYTGNDGLGNKIGDLYRTGQILLEATLVICLRRMETITGENSGRKQALDTFRKYHEEITIRRGINKTMAHLGRTYYWVDAGIKFDSVWGQPQMTVDVITVWPDGYPKYARIHGGSGAAHRLPRSRVCSRGSFEVRQHPIGGLEAKQE
ncbi:hypothetical protein AAG570_000020 [Ranatra chinensis]|uniref:Reverse transcriptase domain-containing protein n=1 Tax=Ranatra chinensis TaxID=642074 RepID=A0ABD0YVW9_9HEMI